MKILLMRIMILVLINSDNLEKTFDNNIHFVLIN